MGSMWLDPVETTQYPVDPSVTVPPYDSSLVVPAPRNVYSQARWGADYKSMLALAEFSATDWKDISVNNPPVLGYTKAVELPALVDQQRLLRPARLPEILAQSYDFQLYMVAQLGISRRSFPATYLALKMAARAGELVMCALKMKHSRPRPSQLYPLLFPPVEVPPHASYPSGHSTISHMMAAAATEIVPIMKIQATALADRISENREIAGLHFKSDTDAGTDAANQAMYRLRMSNFYNDAVAEAMQEWTHI
jgi:hypothetical protein